MATLNFVSNNKQKSAANGISDNGDNDDHSSNLNLNQSHNLLILTFVQSCIKTNKDKHYDSAISESFKGKGALKAWNKSPDLCSNTLKFSDDIKDWCHPNPLSMLARNDAAEKVLPPIGSLIKFKRSNGELAVGFVTEYGADNGVKVEFRDERDNGFSKYVKEYDLCEHEPTPSPLPQIPPFKKNVLVEPNQHIQEKNNGIRSRPRLAEIPALKKVKDEQKCHQLVRRMPRVASTTLLDTQNAIEVKRNTSIKRTPSDDGHGARMAQLRQRQKEREEQYQAEFGILKVSLKIRASQSSVNDVDAEENGQ